MGRGKGKQKRKAEVLSTETETTIQYDFSCQYESQTSLYGQALDKGQWVSSVIKSSEKTGTCSENSVFHIIGPSKVFPQSGNFANTWAPNTSKTCNNNCWAELEYEHLVYVNKVEIFETFDAGCVSALFLRNEDGDWEKVWKESPKNENENENEKYPTAPNLLEIYVPPLGFRSNALKIEFDLQSDRNPHIDGIRLCGGTESEDNGYFVEKKWAMNESSRPIELMATVPNGISVQYSTLTSLTGMNAGNGLFAKWKYSKGDFITEYDGYVVYAARCDAHRMSMNDFLLTSHHRRIENTDWVISGLKTPIRGRGAGSFANDPSTYDKKLINARIITTKKFARKKVAPESLQNTGERKTTRDERNQDTHQILPVVAIQALRDIQIGEEIFVDYKPSTRKRLRIQKFTTSDYLFKKLLRKKKTLINVAPRFKPIGPPPATTEGTDAHSPDGQWVSRVFDYSSEFFSPQYPNNGHEQLVGPPRVYPKFGDFPGSWAPQSRNGEEFLELFFEYPVYPTGIEIYETFTPGVVTSVSVRHHSDPVWQVVWTGKCTRDSLYACARIFRPEIGILNLKCNLVRIEFNTNGNLKWSQIDAVKLRGSLVSPKGPLFTPFIQESQLNSTTTEKRRDFLFQLSPIPIGRDEIKLLNDDEVKNKLQQLYLSQPYLTNLKPDEYKPIPYDTIIEIKNILSPSKYPITALRNRPNNLCTLTKQTQTKPTKKVDLKKNVKQKDQKKQTKSTNQKNTKKTATNQKKLKSNSTVTHKAKKQKTVKETHDWVVGCVCGNDSSDFVGNWVCCDKCDVWFHSDCVGFVGTDEDPWTCNKCTENDIESEIESETQQFFDEMDDNDDSNDNNNNYQDDNNLVDTQQYNQKNNIFLNNSDNNTIVSYSEEVEFQTTFSMNE